MHRILEQDFVIGQRAFTYYRERAKHRNIKNTPRQFYHGVIVNKFWDKVRDSLINRRGGVYIEGLGYFCIMMHPEKAVYEDKNLDKIYSNPHSKSTLYYPAFIPDRSAWVLKTFIMDRNFKDSLKKEISKKIKSGFKYLNFYYELKTAFINKFVLKKHDY